MKRTLYLFITVLLSLGVLAACGQGDEVEENDTGSETEGTADSEETSDEGAEEEGEETENTEEESSNDEEATDVEQEDTVETDSSDEVTETVTLYFSNNDLMETYKEEREIQAESDELPAAALEAWIDGPENDELTTHFQDDIDVESVEEEDGVAQVSFSESFLDANVGSSAELAITEQIALIMEQFGYDETKVLIEGEEEASLFGHMDATEPITAENPDNYESIEESESE